MLRDTTITGLHHITVIAGDPQANVDFYVGVLGMRLVKKTVNQDVPGTYHLFYADGAAHPGTDLTFFPWPDMAPGRRGIGLTVDVALAVPVGSLSFWASQLTAAGVSVGDPELRFGERVLTCTDP
ncbi:MAG: VOC family protein, partial [Gemmatimonadota bacterium]